MSETVIKTCVELPKPAGFRPLPLAMFEPTLDRPPTRAEAAFLNGKLWRDGDVLKVAFLDGDPKVQQKVAEIAQEWSRYADLRFQFVEGKEGDIRISFLQPGSWSYIGNDARLIPKNEPTMNFGWLTPTTPIEEYRRVVLHEFGHVLGMIHEHQSPAAGIPWDKPAVYDYYAGPPNYWTRAEVDVNLFQKYDAEEITNSTFDAESIMLYPIPNQFTIGDYEVGWNMGLSETDKAFAGQVYRKDKNEIIVDAPPRQESIGEAGELDKFTFLVLKPGRYRMETSGLTDVVMMLFGPEDDKRLIAQDDDSGKRLNPRIIRDLEWGQFTLRVEHFSKTGTGAYSIAVTSEPV